MRKSNLSSMEQNRATNHEMAFPTREEIQNASELLGYVWDHGADYAAMLMAPYIAEARNIASGPVAATQLRCMGYLLGETIIKGTKKARRDLYEWPDDLRPETAQAIGILMKGADYAIENHPSPRLKYRRRFTGQALEKLFWPDGEEQKQVREIGWYDWFFSKGPSTGRQTIFALADWEMFRLDES